jgi:hypothetical protein
MHMTDWLEFNLSRLYVEKTWSSDVRKLGNGFSIGGERLKPSWSALRGFEHCERMLKSLRRSGSGQSMRDSCITFDNRHTEISFLSYLAWWTLGRRLIGDIEFDEPARSGNLDPSNDDT